MTTPSTPNIDLNPHDLAEVQRILKEYVPQFEVWAFGSRVTWTAKAYSDLDLAIITDKPLSLGTLADLKNAFDESDLSIKVDLVDWATTGEAFREIIKKTAVALHQQQIQHQRWRPSTWGEEISLEYGKSLRGYENTAGQYRVFGSNGPIGWTDEFLAQGPGVILGRKGAYRGVHFSPDPFFVIDTAYYVVPKTELDMRWLYYAIKHYKLGEIDDGSPIPSTTRAAVYIQDLEVPPPDEQRAIAHILGTLDDKIELNRRMNKTLEAMARALFKSWFVDFEPVRSKAEGRDTGLPKEIADLFPDSFEDSELGEVPKEWRVVTLGDVVSTVKGRSYKSEELIESDTALVTLKSFARGGGYRGDGLKSFAGTFKPEQVVRQGEIVIACTDVTQAAEVIGRPAIVRASQQYKTLVASLDTLIVRPKKESITRSFLYFLGGTESFIAHTYAYVTGTTVLHLSKEAIPTFRFIQPPKQLIDRFEALAVSVMERIHASEQESEFLAAQRDALQPKLLSGELNLSNV